MVVELRSNPMDPTEHLEWINNLPFFYEDDQRIFVHAGLPHDTELKDIDPGIAQWMLYQDESSYKDATYYPDVPHISGKHIVHGHVQSATHPNLKPHRTNLDSFAWYTGRSAIGVFNDEQPQPIEILEVLGPPIE